MSDSKEFQQRVQAIAGLVEQLENVADPAVRASTKQLVQLLMELHRAGLERLLEIVFQSGDESAPIIGILGRDPLVSSLLILYGLHPEELPTRVERAVEQLRPKLRKLGAEASLVSTTDGIVHVRVTVEGHACASTTKTMQSTIEEALYEAAPDMTSLTIDGLDGPSASGFIAMESLLASVPRFNGGEMD